MGMRGHVSNNINYSELMDNIIQESKASVGIAPALDNVLGKVAETGLDLAGKALDNADVTNPEI